MKRKTLTTLEAANIGRKMGVRGLCIYRDDIDRDLWQVVTPGRRETHEPMDEKTWRAFLAASGWIKKTDLYDAGNGRKVTVPENDESDLFDALREQLSPQAVAAIAAHLFAAGTKNGAVNKEIQWFANQLVSMVGVDQYNALCEEVGL